MSEPIAQPKAKMESEEWKATWEHLKEGYKNGQEVIRAVDTKVSVLTGLATFAIAAIAAVAGVVFDWLKDDTWGARQSISGTNAPCVILALFALTAAISIILGARSVWSSMRALIPRRREKEYTDIGATVLFPFLPFGRTQERERCKALQQYQEVLRRDMTIADIRKEYEDQIQNVGNIIGQKVANCSSAVRWFRAQIVFLGIASGLVALFATVCLSIS